jgi:hypothetical protein
MPNYVAERLYGPAQDGTLIMSLDDMAQDAQWAEMRRALKFALRTLVVRQAAGVLATDGQEIE